jgi:cytochrome c oxidase subunit 2
VQVAVLLVGVIALAGCAGADLPQDTLAPEGPVARAQDNLWNLVFYVAVAVFILVEALLLLVLFKFRAKPGHETAELPTQTHGNALLEVLWTIIPALILAFIAVPTVQLIFDLAAEKEGALQVRVIGKQYWWEFEYTGEEGKGVVTANELVIPVNRPVNLTMESTGQQPQPNMQDPGVIHSFWVPKLAGKQDVVPGHIRNLTIEAENPGVSYSGQCAEFCGLSHANMRFAVLAVEPAEFEAYIEEHSSPQTAPSGGDAADGAQLFTDRTCIACHAINGYEGAEARVGPDLTRFAQRQKFAGYILDNDVDSGAENVSAWLKDPQAVKPGSQMPNLGLSDAEVADLVAYLRTLK